MTECERIIKEGILPGSFFEEEVRCGFLVTKERKKIWAVELDLLIEFDRVCKKYGLQYYLIHGSLLGAIRHNGFIPWDDDIDVAMLRYDYEILLQIAQKEFRKPYFFQTPYTDNGYFFSFAKIRNGNTTGISIPFRNEQFNQGLFLDVFPLDNCPLEDAEKRYEKIKELIIDNSNYMRRKSPDENDKIRFAHHSGKNPMESIKELERIQKMYADCSDCEYVNNSAITIYPCKKLLYTKDAFKKAIMHDFEGFTFPIPHGYKHILEVNYGDFLEMPPIEERGKWHDTLIANPDIPYKKYQSDFGFNNKYSDYKKDTQFWNKFYKDNPPASMEASLFAKFVSKYVVKGKTLVDIGCGNGRDSFYLNGLGLNVYGIDASDVAVEELNKHSSNALRFICGNFINEPSIFKSNTKIDYFYSRFTLHAIDEQGENELLKNVFNTLSDDGQLFIETRGIHDSKYGLGKNVDENAYILDGHYRRFININELIKKLIEIGFSIKYAEEAKDFAPYKEENDEIIRIIALKKKEEMLK